MTLAEWRKEAGLTKRELSLSMARPNNYVHKVENGEKGVEFVDLVDYVRALGRDMRESFLLLAERVTALD